MSSCRRCQLNGSECITFIGYFPSNLFGISNFNKTKIYKRLELKFTSLRNDMNWYITLKVIRQDGEVVLNSLVIFAIICYYNFNIEAWCDSSLFTKWDRKTSWFWLFDSNLLFFIRHISNKDGDLINLIKLGIKEMNLLLRQLENSVIIGINKWFIMISFSSWSINNRI